MLYLKTLYLFGGLYNVVIGAFRKVLPLIFYWKIARELAAFEVLFSKLVTIVNGSKIAKMQRKIAELR